METRCRWPGHGLWVDGTGEAAKGNAVAIDFQVGLGVGDGGGGVGGVGEDRLSDLAENNEFILSEV